MTMLPPGPDTRTEPEQALTMGGEVEALPGMLHFCNLRGDEVEAYAHPESNSRLTVRPHNPPDAESPRGQTENQSDFLGVFDIKYRWGDRQLPQDSHELTDEIFAIHVGGCRENGGEARYVFAHPSDEGMTFHLGVSPDDTPEDTGSWTQPAWLVGCMMLSSDKIERLAEFDIKAGEHMEHELREYAAWTNGEGLYRGPGNL